MVLEEGEGQCHHVSALLGALRSSANSVGVSFGWEGGGRAEVVELPPAGPC